MEREKKPNCDNKTLFGFKKKNYRAGKIETGRQAGGNTNDENKDEVVVILSNFNTIRLIWQFGCHIGTLNFAEGPKL